MHEHSAREDVDIIIYYIIISRTMFLNNFYYSHDVRFNRRSKVPREARYSDVDTFFDSWWCEMTYMHCAFKKMHGIP